MNGLLALAGLLIPPAARRPPCPFCSERSPAVDHYRDTGEFDPSAAARLGFCPELAARRQPPR